MGRNGRKRFYFKDISPTFKSSHDYVLEAVGPELPLLIPYEKVISK